MTMKKKTTETTSIHKHGDIWEGDRNTVPESGDETEAATDETEVDVEDEKIDDSNG